MPPSVAKDYQSHPSGTLQRANCGHYIPPWPEWVCPNQLLLLPSHLNGELLSEGGAHKEVGPISKLSPRGSVINEEE